MPNLREEKKWWVKGYKNIVCLDEAGRGAIGGPVVAAAVMIKNPKLKSPMKIGILNSFGNLKIRDSKKLTRKQREKIYSLIIKSPQLEWGIGQVSEKVIDKINILEATKLAMKKAFFSVKKRFSKLHHSGICKNSIFLILDGNFKIDLPIPQKSITKADEKVFSCAIASIIAKVTRDRIMKKYHQKYPQYGFAKHKGYPTKYHLKALKKYGPSVIHRKSFRPLKNLV